MLIPVPSDAYQPKFKLSWNCGTAEYYSQKESILWKISQFQGLKELSLSASFSLPSVAAQGRDNFKSIPCELSFSVPSYTVSGVQVRYFKIQEKSNYDNYPWVRYLVKNGDYHVRTGLNTTL